VRGREGERIGGEKTFFCICAPTPLLIERFHVLSLHPREKREKRKERKEEQVDILLYLNPLQQRPPY